jgi:hypothetical protein
MSGTLLHRAPSHQPPPPSASKSRSRGSCHNAGGNNNDNDDGVPNLDLNTAHYTNGVVEVTARRSGPGTTTCFAPPPISIARSTATHTTSTLPLLQQPCYLPPHSQRSRLEAEEEPLQDSLSYSEVATSLKVDNGDQRRLHSAARDSADSSVVFAGQDDVEEVNVTSDTASTSFCAPSTRGVEARGRVGNESSAEQSPVFYEERRDGRSIDGGSNTFAPHPYDCTASQHSATTTVPTYAALHIGLDVEGQPERTSRKLVYSASATLTSPVENSTAWKSKGGVVSDRHGNDEDNESASSPQLHHTSSAHVNVLLDSDVVHTHLRRMAPLVPPVLIEEDEGEKVESLKDVNVATERLSPSRSSHHSSHAAAADLNPGEVQNTFVAASTALHPPQPLPPTPHSDLDRADAEMESAMKEMAERLRSRDRAGRRRVDSNGGGDDQLSSGAVRSKENSPPAPSATSSAVSTSPRFHKEAADDVGRSSVLSETPDEPHLLHESCDLVESGGDDDVASTAGDAVMQRSTAIKSPDDTEDDAVVAGGECDVRHRSSYAFFSSQLPQPMDRRAHIHELAKILREGEALLMSPRGHDAPNDTKGDEEDANGDNYADVAGGGEEEGCVRQEKDATPVQFSPPPPPPRRRAPLTSPLAVPPVSREASLSLGEASMAHASATMATFAAHSATSPSLPTQQEPHTSPAKPSDVQLGDTADAAATVRATAADVYVSHSTGIDLAGTATADGLEGKLEMLCGPMTPAKEHPASTEEGAPGDVNASTASLSASTSQRHRPPPRLLCPPTPSPSRSRVDGDADVSEVLQPQGDVSAESRELQGLLKNSSAATTGAAGAVEGYLDSDAVPVVVPHSTSAAVALRGLIAPFTNLHHPSAPLLSSPEEKQLSAPSPPPAEAVVEEGCDSTASVLTVPSDGERNDGYPHSVLLGPIDASVCAAEEDVPAPLSPKVSREPSIPSQRPLRGGATRHADAATAPPAPASASVAAAWFCRTDKEERQGLAPLTNGGAAAAGGTALIQSTSVVRRTLDQPTEHEKDAGEGLQLSCAARPFPLSQPSSQRTPSHLLARYGSSEVPVAGAAATAPELWSTVDELEGTQDEEGEAEGLHDQLPLPPFSISEGSHRPLPKSPTSDTSSPLPVRPIMYDHCLGMQNEMSSGSEDDEAHLLYETSGAGHPPNAKVGRPTWQSDTFSGGLFDDNDEDDNDGDGADAHTSMEEMLQRAEGTSAVLRLELTAATSRAVAAEEALLARSEECAELHALVDRLQTELAAAAAAAGAAGATVCASSVPSRADAAVQAAEHSPPPAPRIISPAQNSPSAVPAVPSSAPRAQGRGDGSGGLFSEDACSSNEWRCRHDTVALELAAVKSSMAEQLAVLDRLGLHPPFTEEVVAAAQRRLRHVRVVNARSGVAAAGGAKSAVHDGTRQPSATATGVAAPPAKMRAGDKNSLVSLLARRKQLQQRQQQEQEIVGEKGVKAKSRSGSLRDAADAKENTFSSQR